MIVRAENNQKLWLITITTIIIIKNWKDLLNYLRKISFLRLLMLLKIKKTLKYRTLCHSNNQLRKMFLLQSWVTLMVWIRKSSLKRIKMKAVLKRKRLLLYRPKQWVRTCQEAEFQYPNNKTNKQHLLLQVALMWIANKKQKLS